MDDAREAGRRIAAQVPHSRTHASAHTQAHALARRRPTLILAAALRSPGAATAHGTGPGSRYRRLAARRSDSDAQPGHTTRMPDWARDSNTRLGHTRHTRLGHATRTHGSVILVGLAASPRDGDEAMRRRRFVMEAPRDGAGGPDRPAAGRHSSRSSQAGAVHAQSDLQDALSALSALPLRAFCTPSPHCLHSLSALPLCALPTPSPRVLLSFLLSLLGCPCAATRIPPAGRRAGGPAVRAEQRRGRFSRRRDGSHLCMCVFMCAGSGQVGRWQGKFNDKMVTWTAAAAGPDAVSAGGRCRLLARLSQFESFRVGPSQSESPSQARLGANRESRAAWTCFAGWGGTCSG